MPAALVAVSMLSAVLTLVPMPWHWRSKNIPSVMLMIWISQGNFFRGISAAMWSGSVVRKNLVFCDIVLALQMASAWGICACVFCTTRHLESISSPRYSSSGLNDPRKKKYFDIFMTIIAPFIFAAIHLIVQGHRFDIVEDIGCTSTTYWSWASIWLFYFPPLALSLATTVYGFMALRWFIQRRAQFRDLLASSGITGSRYLRLMGLSLAEMICATFANIYVISQEAHYPLRPWISWQNVHSNFSRVAQWPLALYTPEERRNLWGVWSLYAISGFLFFAFFAFGQEAMYEYKKSYIWVKTTVFRIPQEENNNGNLGTLPSFVANSSMASKNPNLHSNHSTSKVSRSMTASEKYEAGLDLDADSLYDADERRGRRSMGIGGDLESGVDTMDQKSYAASFDSSNYHQRAQSPIPPLPTLVTKPESAATRNSNVRLSISRSESSDSGSVVDIPSAI